MVMLTNEERYFTIHIGRRDFGLFGSADEAEQATKLAPLPVPPYTIRELTADEVNRLDPEDIAAAGMAHDQYRVRDDA